jgi:hypothetical protein
MDELHKYMFDEENMLFLLKMVGFKNPRIRDYDPSIDKLHRRDESLFAIAEK